MPVDPTRLATDTLLTVRAIESQMSAHSESVLEKAGAIPDPDVRESSLEAWRSAMGSASANVDQALATVFRTDTAKLQSAFDQTAVAQSQTDAALQSLDDIAKTIGLVAKAVGLVGQVLASLP